MFTGIEQAPKCIYVQIDLMEQGKTMSVLALRRRIISLLIIVEK